MSTLHSRLSQSVDNQTMSDKKKRKRLSNSVKTDGVDDQDENFSTAMEEIRTAAVDTGDEIIKVKSKKSGKNKKKIDIKSGDDIEETDDRIQVLDTSEADGEVDDKKGNRKNKIGRHLTCILCRQDGHIAKNCRLNKGSKIDLAICFNCGSRDHILKECTVPKSSTLSYATCFICKQQGHIAKDCSENPNGLYPNGGCCHVCKMNTHFSRDCSLRIEQNKKRKGFSKPASSSGPLKIPVGDDELEDEPLYEVDTNFDENTPKKKFNMKNKYFAKPKPRK